MKTLILSHRCAAGRAGDVIKVDESYARRLISRGLVSHVKQESRKTATRKEAKEE